MAGEEEEFLPPSETGDLEQGVHYELSPDGYVQIVYIPEERRNNEWWEGVSVYLAKRGRRLFSLPYFFEADVKWTGPRTFAMFVRKAYSGGTLRVDVDVDAAGKKGRCVVAKTSQSIRFRDADRLIERAFERHATYPEPSPDQSPPVVAPPPKPRRVITLSWTKLKDLVLGLLLGAAFIAALAYGTYWWHQDDQPEPRYPIGSKMKELPPDVYPQPPEGKDN